MSFSITSYFNLDADAAGRCFYNSNIFSSLRGVVGSGLFFRVTFLLLVCAVTSGSPPPKMYEQEAQLSDGINRFSQDFYKAVAELQPGKNLIMSPLSAEVVLAMLSLGARGDTQKELLSTLHLPDADFTRAAFRPALEKLGAIEGVTLQLANKVYVKDGAQYQLDAAYRKDAEEIFRSEIENINFTAAKSAANTINSWVEQKTNNKIKDLIEESALNQDTRLVLLNAIYFKGKWDKPFKAENTMKEDFHVSSTETKKVDMMHLTDKFRYAEVPEWDATVLELPYHKHQVAMLVVLPNKVDGLPALEAKMATADLRSVLQNLRRAEVEVALPKFRIETTMDLKKTLIKMGLSRIFDNRAELGGLLQNQEPLQVSEAIQKAFIEVNEEGAEAAAATGMVFMLTSMPQPLRRVQFTADRPFYLALLARSAGGQILFQAALRIPQL